MGKGRGKTRVVSPARDPRAVLDGDLELLIEALADAPSALGVVYGAKGEAMLKRQLRELPGVTEVEKADDHDRGSKNDYWVTYRGLRFRIESKAVQSASVELRDGVLCGTVQVDGSDCSARELPNGHSLQATNLVVGGFDILAVCLFGLHGRWEYQFALNRDLPRTKAEKFEVEDRQHLLATMVPVIEEPQAPFVATALELLELLYQERQAELAAA